VTVLDVASLADAKRIPSGKSPRRRWLLRTDGGSRSPTRPLNDVHVIADGRRHVVKQIPVRRNRAGMRLHGRLTRLFVASEQAHVVSVIDMTQMRVVKSARPAAVVPSTCADSGRARGSTWSHGQSGDVRVLDSASAERARGCPSARAPGDRVQPGCAIPLRYRRTCQRARGDRHELEHRGRADPLRTLPWGCNRRHGPDGVAARPHHEAEPAAGRSARGSAVESPRPTRARRRKRRSGGHGGRGSPAGGGGLAELILAREAVVQAQEEARLQGGEAGEQSGG